MIYRFFILFGFMITFFMPDFATAVDANAFDMEDYAIVDSEEVDITTDGVVLNMDADAANVSSFDIAGIMLGMSFDDVQTLFFDNRGLYTPRKKNSIIYTIHNDWKYNFHPTSTHTAETSYLKSKDIFVE